MTHSRQIQKAPLLLALLMMPTSYIHAFVNPFVPRNTPQRVDSSKIRPASSRRIMVAPSSPPHESSSPEKSGTVEINRQLEELAARCGNFNNDVISLASQCQDLFESCESPPNVNSLRTVLQAWSKTCATLAERRNAWGNGSSQPVYSDSGVPVYTARDAAERATQLLLDMEERADALCIPDTACYNTVIDAWSKSRCDDAPQACERLLKKLLDHPTFHPNIESYNFVLEAWSHSSLGEEALERIVKIYRHLQQEQEKTMVLPTIQTMNIILAAHSKQAYHAQDKEAVAKAAHAIFNETLAEGNTTALEPTIMTYTSVMEAYAKCGTLECTKCVQQLLEQLKTAYAESKNAKLQPTTRTYTALVTAWAKTKSLKAPHEAEALLKEMEESNTIKPNTRTYTAAIQAWGRSRDATKPQRALRILKHMKALKDANARPNLVTYNAAIDACARCQGTTKQQTEALKIAFAILKSIQMEPDIEANQVTFATILKATAFLLPAGEERNKVASALFEKAKAAGMVDMNMIKNMRKAVDNNVMQDLFHDLKARTGHIDYSNVPPAWSRNIR